MTFPWRTLSQYWSQHENEKIGQKTPAVKESVVTSANLSLKPANHMIPPCQSRLSHPSTDRISSIPDFRDRFSSMSLRPFSPSPHPTLSKCFFCTFRFLLLISFPLLSLRVKFYCYVVCHSQQVRLTVLDCNTGIDCWKLCRCMNCL